MQILACVAVCLAVQLVGAAGKSASLPSDFPTCRRNDEPCLKQAVQYAVTVMSKGLPKLGVLSIDPLRVTEMPISQGGSGGVSINLTLKNQDLMGISTATITKVKSVMNDESYMLGIEGDISVFALMGDYVIDGRVLVLPIRGHGKDNLTLTDLSAKLVINGHVVERQGEQFIDVDDVLFTFDTTRLYLDLENLFNGDKTLGDNMVHFLNENWSVILQELKGSIQGAVGEVFLEVVKRIYTKVPYPAMHPVA